MFRDYASKASEKLAVSDKPTDFLLYYDADKHLIDPTKDLSSHDKALIDRWMDKSESLSTDEVDMLSDADRAQIELWMVKSESLPLDYTPEPSFLDKLTRFWGKLYEARYAKLSG